MSNEQRGQEQQQPQVPEQARTPRGEVAKRGALAVVGGVVSGTVRALWTHVLGDDA